MGSHTVAGALGIRNIIPSRLSAGWQSAGLSYGRPLTSANLPVAGGRVTRTRDFVFIGRPADDLAVQPWLCRACSRADLWRRTGRRQMAGQMIRHRAPWLATYRREVQQLRRILAHFGARARTVTCGECTPLDGQRQQVPLRA